MPEPPDLQDLAKRYLDLWQEQLGGLATDDQTSEIMARTMSLMNAGAANFAAMMQAAGAPADNKADNRDLDGRNTTPPDPAPPSGAASAAAAHGGSDDDVAKLARRLERLEQRIAALEGGARKKG